MLAVPSAFMETSRWGGGVRMYAGYFTSLPYWKGEGEIKFPSFTLTLIYLKKKKKKSLFISGCARSSLLGTAFSSCGGGGYCPVVQSLLASVVVEHRLQARGLQ